MPLLGSEERRILRGRALGQAAVRPLGVVLLAPLFDHSAGLAEGREVMLVQALIAQLAVEAFDEAVLHRMARANEVEGDVVRGRPLIESQAHE